MSLFNRVFILIAAFLSAGCLGEPDPETGLEIPVISFDSAEIDTMKHMGLSLTPVTEYHDSLYIESISAVDIDSNGQVYIAAERHQVRSVYLYSQQGELLDTLGSYGNSHDEFESIRNIQIADNSLYVFDDHLRRVTQFSLPDYAVINTTQFNEITVREQENPVEFFPSPVALWNDGNYLIEYRDNQNPAIYNSRVQFYRTGTVSGDVSGVDLFELPAESYLIGDHAGRPSAFLLPYPERSLMTRLKDDLLYTAWTEEFEIQQRTSSGEVIQKIAFPYRRAGLDAEKMVSEHYSHNRQLQLTRESAEYPSEWPAIFKMLLDDRGQIWLALIPEDESTFEWWIIDPGAERNHLKAIFNWPRESLFTRISETDVYALESDEDGFKKIVRYKIQSD